MRTLPPSRTDPRGRTWRRTSLAAWLRRSRAHRHRAHRLRRRSWRVVPREAGRLRPRSGSRVHQSLGELAEGLVVRVHDLLRGREHARSALADGFDDEALAIGGHVELGLSVDAQKLEDRLLDHDSETVTDGGEFLHHGRAPFLLMYNVVGAQRKARPS